MSIRLTLAALATAASTVSAFAGGLEPVVIETPPPVVVEEASRGSLGLLLPLIVIGLLIALATSSSSTPAVDNG